MLALYDELIVPLWAQRVVFHVGLVQLLAGRAEMDDTVRIRLAVWIASD